MFPILFISWQIISNTQNPDTGNNEGELYRTVNSVTKNSFEGDWYEIARTPNQVQENCISGTPYMNIFYEVVSQSGGGSRHLSTTIKNKCQVSVNDKKRYISYSLPAGNEIYKQPFYTFFSAKYLYDFIYVKRVKNYKGAGPYPYDYAVLASGDYVWFLSRENTIPQDIFDEMKTAVQNAGTDISDLIVSPSQNSSM